MGPGGRERVTLFERTPAGLQRRAKVASAHFVRLLGRHGFEDS
jgi:protein-L-isoaspartate(D-aspartate) O-methyltransferase